MEDWQVRAAVEDLHSQAQAAGCADVLAGHLAGLTRLAAQLDTADEPPANLWAQYRQLADKVVDVLESRRQADLQAEPEPVDFRLLVMEKGGDNDNESD